MEKEACKVLINVYISRECKVYNYTWFYIAHDQTCDNHVTIMQDAVVGSDTSFAISCTCVSLFSVFSSSIHCWLLLLGVVGVALVGVALVCGWQRLHLEKGYSNHVL